MHTPRSTLAASSDAAGASLPPLYDAHRAFVLGAQVLHADETPVRMLDAKGHAEAPSGPSGNQGLRCGLGLFLHDGEVSIDNNHVERLMRLWPMGRKARLFCGSELAGQRAAMVMSLVQWAKLNGHGPWAYFRDVLERCLRIRTTGSTSCCRIVGARRRPARCRRMKNFEALIADGGAITLGRVYLIECAATAADGHNSVAMLVRRGGETLNALLKRLDKAIGRYFDHGEFVDQMNGA